MLSYLYFCMSLGLVLTQPTALISRLRLATLAANDPCHCCNTTVKTTLLKCRCKRSY